MIKQCSLCSKDFITYKSKILLGRGKFCSKECSNKVVSQRLENSGKITRFKKGNKPWNKKGFVYHRSRKNGKRYKLIKVQNHPFATRRGYIREHRFIIEQSIGRFLRKDEIVHHINEDTCDNRIENLKLMTKKEHDSLSHEYKII